MQNKTTAARISALAVVLIATAAGRAAADAEAAGKIDAVTVYRGQALVTRLVDVPGPAGLTRVVVTNLPEQVVEGSVYAEADAGGEIRGTIFRTRAVSEDTSEAVRKYDGQIRLLQDQLAAGQKQQQVQAEARAYLRELQNFTAATATAELTRGVLNADTLKTLTLFVFDQQKSLAEAELSTAKSGRDLAEALALVQRQKGEVTAGSGKTVREAVVSVNLTRPNGRLRVKYLVGSSTWSPSYVARATDGKPGAKRTVALQYNAAVQQLSGEDWTDVVMTLSTATPSMVSTAPPLDPLQISLVGVQAASQDSGSYRSRKAELSQQREQLEITRNASGGQAGFGGRGGNFNGAQNGQSQTGGYGGGTLPLERSQEDIALNTLSGRMQVLELASKDAESRDRGIAAGNKEGISVTYQLPARTSLASRADEQSIQISSAYLTGDFYKLAMPVLTSYVYDQATVTNDGKTVLLAGTVQSYLNDQYVGIGNVPTVSVGEKFTLGFGIDSSLRAARELVQKSETIQGGNRQLTFDYRLSVENFGTTPAMVRLMDRLPTSKDQEVKVSMAGGANPTSTQPVGTEGVGAASHPTGILNWTVPVPAQSPGSKAAAVDYSFKMEFDKQLAIAGGEK